MNKATFAPLLIMVTICMGISSNVLATPNQHTENSKKILHESLDSSDDIVGNAVQGTGNAIRSTKSAVDDVTSAIGDTVTDAADAD